MNRSFFVMISAAASVAIAATGWTRISSGDQDSRSVVTSTESVAYDAGSRTESLRGYDAGKASSNTSSSYEAGSSISAAYDAGGGASATGYDAGPAKLGSVHPAGSELGSGYDAGPLGVAPTYDANASALAMGYDAAPLALSPAYDAGRSIRSTTSLSRAPESSESSDR